MLRGVRTAVILAIEKTRALSWVSRARNLRSGDFVLANFEDGQRHHQGEFFGVAPTGKRVEMRGIQINRFDEEGKIVAALS